MDSLWDQTFQGIFYGFMRLNSLINENIPRSMLSCFPAFSWSWGWNSGTGIPVGAPRGDSMGGEAETFLQRCGEAGKGQEKLQREPPGCQECRGVGRFFPQINNPGARYKGRDSWEFFHSQGCSGNSSTSLLN